MSLRSSITGMMTTGLKTDSNETYLESFIEHISTLPSEIRRNLDLMKDLDKSCSTLYDEMTRLQQEYVNQVEDKISQLEIVTSHTVVDPKTGEETIVKLDKPHIRDNSTTATTTAMPTTTTATEEADTTDEDGDTTATKDKDGDTEMKPSSSSSKSKKKKRQRDISSEEEEDEEEDEEEEEEDDTPTAISTPSNIMIPTTEELSRYVHNNNSQLQYKQIERIEQDALQRAEEKVTVANQTYALVDATCKRLDNDLFELEQLLHATGEFQALYPGGIYDGAGRQNDLAAIQINVNSPDTWILAKVITHDPQSGMYKLSDEDVESNKTFTLPESQVVILGGLKNLSRGDAVFAVYPDTTSFYQATVVQNISTKESSSSRKSSSGRDSARLSMTAAAVDASGIIGGIAGGGALAAGSNQFVMVNFVDDSDEHGITHDKAVLLNHVMLPPYGVTLA